jgi:hypothetical protein
MLLDVEVHFADGGEALTLTSNASWQYALGEVTSTHFNGESVDKRWALPANWAMANGSGGGAGSGPPPWGAWRPVQLLDGPPALFPGSILTSQKEPPTLAGGLLLLPQTVRRLPAANGSTVHILDFGREVQGRPVLTATASAPGLQLRTLVCGSFYLTRKFTCDETTASSLNNGEGPGLYNFTLAGSGGGEEEEEYRPHFTYSALRRLVVHVPAGAALVGAWAEQVVMAQPATATFASSSDTYNWLHEALARTQENYCTGFPNDPSRERVGYTQDVMNMFRGAALHFSGSSAQMYQRWMEDMVDGQAYSALHPGTGIPPGVGQMPTVIPGPKSDQANSVFWGGMVVWLPWRHYLHYGDERVLRRMYAPMVGYLEYLNASAPTGLVTWGLADWNSPLPQCSAWGYGNATALINTPGLYLLSAILRDVAGYLGKAEDAARFDALATRVAAVYNAAFLNASSGAYGPGQQCHQAMALAMPGLVPEGVRGAAVAALVARAVSHDNSSLTVGFVSFLHAVLALAEADEGGVLHALVTRRNYGPAEGAPGYCAGADGPGGRPSTEYGCAPGPHANSVGALPSSDLMKESWQGLDAVMPSLTGPLMLHSFHVLAGIRSAEDLSGAGFANFTIFPSPVGGLLWVNCSVLTRLGVVEVRWVVQEEAAVAPVAEVEAAGAAGGRHFFLSVSLPPGATATVGLPCSPGAEAGGAQGARGAARTLVVVGSGTHAFDCMLSSAGG